MMIREPAVAGMFYAADQPGCLSQIEECLREVGRREARGLATTLECDRIIGGVVPHAGWVCSGAVVARVIGEIARRRPPQVVVVFGAIHILHGPRASVFPSGAWETPLGLALVDDRLVERLTGQTNLLESSPHAQEGEHSIEVEVPFVQRLLPEALIVPILVPVNDKAAALGAAVGRTCRSYGVDAVFLASSDFTHYGPSYQFTPQGTGPAGIAWAREVNDRRMIDLILAMREGEAVREAVMNRSACGGGAIDATIAACRAFGANRASLLEHTNSYEVLSRLHDEPARDAVGYAAIVFD